MSRPRLIFVNRIYWPEQAATAQLLTDLAEGLAARGWPVHVIAAGETSLTHCGVVVHRTGGAARHHGLISRTRNYRGFIRRAREVLPALAQPGSTVIFMTDPPMLGTRLARTAESKGASVIHWIQDIYPEIVSAHVGAIAALPLQPLRWQRNAAWRSAHRCVVLGAHMAAKVAQQGVSPDRIATIPNWAPRELETKPGPDEIAARREAWGIKDRFVVAYSGNLGRVHEFAAILGAAKALKAKQRIIFLFIGGGARLAEVRAAATAENLTNIKFLPAEPRENLAASLAAADVHVVTLKPEFAPLVYPSKLAGTLAAGRPVIFVGPAQSEIGELLERAQCGASVTPQNGAGLAGTILKWEQSSATREQLGRNARAAYEQRFTFEAALNRWSGLLEHPSIPT